MNGGPREESNGRGRLAFARIVRDPRELPTDSAQELRDALVPGTRIERHRRVWRMGQTREADGVIYGRVGFESSGSITEVWNADKKDFEEHVFPSGVTSPFAIRVTDLRIAFQMRGATIRRQSFIGALQALLREASRSSWRVETLRRPIPFEEWRGQVDRIVKLRFRLERPNPHYGDRDYIQALVGATGSALTQVVLNAGGDDLAELNVDSDFIVQAIDHAESYGDFSATGERQIEGETERVTWVKGTGEEVEQVVGADPETGEVSQAELTQGLTTIAQETEAGIQDDNGATGPRADD